MNLALNSPIKNINKIASDLSSKFKKLGLETIQDLLFYFPYRYDDYSNLILIEDILPNTLTTLKVKIELIESRRSFRKKMIVTEALVSDETGKIKIVWFNQRFVIKMLNVGDEIYLSGKPVVTNDNIEFRNPAFEKINKYDTLTMHTNRLVPIYSSTEKLTQKQIRFVIKNILKVTSQITEWLPKDILKKEKFFPLSQAIHQIHFPANKENLKKARRRLKFDEIFLLQLRNNLAKQEILKQKSPIIKFKEKITKDFIKNLPFELTQSQKKSAWEIIQDLEKKHPMNRLLEGDVGSGKTITTALPILNALLNKFQVAYMSPTEILAQQQFNNFCKIFSDYNFNIALLTRSNSKIFNTQTNTVGLKHSVNVSNGRDLSIKKIDLHTKIKQKEIDFAIGTHSLIQDKTNFRNLGLVIVDEQHRFGISQRKKLKEKNISKLLPHFLSMTATPIPRSLALTIYSELALSIIDEMPKNRQQIISKIIEPHKRYEAYNLIKNELKKGRQIFIVCPLIDPSDKLGVKAVKEEFEKLDKTIFTNEKVALLHGKLKPQDKEKIMREFYENKIQILVSTMVIEVGIDIPNASVMMIESAERFGLAQLHQLRGRVGRSQHQSYCLLLTESENETTQKRLHALVESKNGFELAEKDLEFRGPGEVYGIQQSGFYDSLKIAKLTDWPIIKLAKPWAEKILEINPDLKKFPLIKSKLDHFETKIHFE